MSGRTTRESKSAILHRQTEIRKAFSASQSQISASCSSFYEMPESLWLISCGKERSLRKQLTCAGEAPTRPLRHCVANVSTSSIAKPSEMLGITYPE